MSKYVIKLAGDYYCLSRDSYSHVQYIEVFDSVEEAESNIRTNPVTCEGAWVEALEEV